MSSTLRWPSFSRKLSRMSWRCGVSFSFRSCRYSMKTCISGAKAFIGLMAAPLAWGCALSRLRSASGLHYLWLRPVGLALRPLRSWCRLSGWQQLNDVVVKNDHRQHQKENETRLNDPLLHTQAEITAHQRLDDQKQDYTAIENRYRQYIQNTEIQAYDGHKCQQRGETRFIGLA